MGFKLKKKNTGEGSSRKIGDVLFAKIQSQTDQLSRVFGDSEKSKPLILGAAFCLVLEPIQNIFYAKEGLKRLN